MGALKKTRSVQKVPPKENLAYISTDHLFHNLWTNAVGTPGYDKQKWLELERRLSASSKQVSNLLAELANIKGPK